MKSLSPSTPTVSTTTQISSRCRPSLSPGFSIHKTTTSSASTKSTATTTLSTEKAKPSTATSGKLRQKIFTCSVPGCRKPFSKKWNMQAHMRLHTGSTPFACRLGCGASYMWMSSRKGHELNRCRFASVVPEEFNPSKRPSRYRSSSTSAGIDHQPQSLPQQQQQQQQTREYSYDHSNGTHTYSVPHSQLQHEQYQQICQQPQRQQQHVYHQHPQSHQHDVHTQLEPTQQQQDLSSSSLISPDDTDKASCPYYTQYSTAAAFTGRKQQEEKQASSSNSVACTMKKTCTPSPAVGQQHGSWIVTTTQDACSMTKKNVKLEPGIMLKQEQVMVYDNVTSSRAVSKRRTSVSSESSATLDDDIRGASGKLEYTFSDVDDDEEEQEVEIERKMGVKKEIGRTSLDTHLECLSHASFVSGEEKNFEKRRACDVEQNDRKESRSTGVSRTDSEYGCDVLADVCMPDRCNFSEEFLNNLLLG